MIASCRRLFGAASWLLGFLLIPCVCHAQNARFVGQITDPQNAAIGHASVEVTNEDTAVQLHTESDDSGSYTIPYLPAGRYRIVVEAPGFNISAQEVTLGMGQTLVFNIEMRVGETQTTLSVQGGSELTELHLENAEVS
jgi:hypothetical protein